MWLFLRIQVSRTAITLFELILDARLWVQYQAENKNLYLQLVGILKQRNVNSHIRPLPGIYLQGAQWRTPDGCNSTNEPMATIYSAILRIISRNAKDPTSTLHLVLHTIDVLPFSRSRPDTQSRYHVQRESLQAVIRVRLKRILIII